MAENGNKGGGKLLSLILILPLAALLLCLALRLTPAFESKPIYIDPVPSPVLVRGSILDRNGEYLAIQAPDYGFAIHISDAYPSIIASFISDYTDENAISIEEKIERGDKFIVITTILSTDEIAAIQKRLSSAVLSDDISVAVIERRKYPQQSASSITGSVDSTFHGISGIEKLMDSMLSAVPSIDSYIEHGNDVVLTIDINMQDKLEEKYGKSEAALLSPDGEVLAYTGSDEAILESLIAESSSSFPYTAKATADGYFLWEGQESET